MGDTDLNQLETEEELDQEEVEIEEEHEEVAVENTTMRDELLKAFADKESEEEEETDDEEPEDEAQDFSSRISEDLKSTFDYLKKEQRDALEKADYPEELLNMFLGQVKSQTSAFHEKTKNFSDLTKVIEPFGDSLALQGITPAQKISQYIAYDKQLQANPIEGLFQLAKSHGIDLVKEVSKMQSTSHHQFEDPVSKEVTSIKKELEDLKNATLSERQEAAQKIVDDFANAKDEKGQPLHPHYELLRGKMRDKFQSREASDLKTAYELVLKEFPQLTRAELTDNAKPILRKSVKDKKRAAQGVHSKSSASKVTTSGAMSVKDELRLRLKAAKG